MKFNTKNCKCGNLILSPELHGNELGYDKCLDCRNNNDQEQKYRLAVSLVKTNNKASVSFVQRHLKVSYKIADEFIQRMECEGLVSPRSNTGSRTVLVQS